MTGAGASIHDVFVVAGVHVTAQGFAQARQKRASDGASYIPTWEELTAHEKAMATLDAANWLHTLAGLAAGVEQV